MATSTDVKNNVKEYIKKATFADDSKIKDDTMLFKEGLFDSMGFVSLIAYLEETFGVETNDDDLVEENFESVNAIVKYVSSKVAVEV